MDRPAIVDRYRRAEYTGENRCLACTAVNVVLAVTMGVSALLAVLAVGGSPTLGLLVELVVLAAAFVQIWLRGYLVPFTPTLTNRYFPPWLLGVFAKESAEETGSDSPRS